jgi:hypothetical protein
MKGVTIVPLSHVPAPRNSFRRAEATVYQLDEKTLVALQDWAFERIQCLCRKRGRKRFYLFRAMKNHLCVVFILLPKWETEV